MPQYEERFDMTKKIISFSLYGTNKMYQVGALRNLELQPQIYPGWTCRFYVSQEVPDGMIDQLKSGGAEVIFKHRQHGTDGMFWRFLPAAEPNLDALIVRDADSRLSLREKHAVDVWLESGKAFHIMRDHPAHTALIVGGSWGCRGGVLPDMESMINGWSQFDMRGRDQEFLAIHIYPRIRSDVLIHTDLVKYSGEIVHPFPDRRREHEFVVEIYTANDERYVQSESVRRKLDAGVLKEYPLPPHCRRYPRLAWASEMFRRSAIRLLGRDE